MCSVLWRTIMTLVSETALVSLRTLAFFFPLVTGTLSSFNATQALSPLDHCSCFDFPVSGVKVSKSKFSDLYSSSPSFSIFDDWASISFDESPSRTTLILF